MLTLVVITHNEVDRIAACLASVPFASRRLVLDSGSSDGTADVARACGAEVHETDWPGFAAQRNRAIAMVRTPFVLFLDADERLSPAAMRVVPRLLASSGASGWSFRRANTWQGKVLRHGLWYPDRQLRLMKRDAGRWVGEVHERLQVRGRVEVLDAEILHDPYRNLREHWAAIDRYTALEAASATTGAAAWDPVLHAGWHGFRSLVLRSAWRDGPRGVAVAAIGTVGTALKWKRIRACASS